MLWLITCQELFFIFYSIEQSLIHDNFHDDQLFSVSKLPWFADIANYLVTCNYSEQWGQ